MFHLDLVNATHGFHLLLLHLQLGLPEEICASHIFTLAIQSVKHQDGHQKQKEALDLKWQAVKTESRV